MDTTPAMALSVMIRWLSGLLLSARSRNSPFYSRRLCSATMHSSAPINLCFESGERVDQANNRIGTIVMLLFIVMKRVWMKLKRDCWIDIGREAMVLFQMTMTITLMKILKIMSLMGMVMMMRMGMVSFASVRMMTVQL